MIKSFFFSEKMNAVSKDNRGERFRLKRVLTQLSFIKDIDKGKVRVMLTIQDWKIWILGVFGRKNHKPFRKWKFGWSYEHNQEQSSRGIQMSKVI